jgi:hypothetical protein
VKEEEEEEEGGFLLAQEEEKYHPFAKNNELDQKGYIKGAIAEAIIDYSSSIAVAAASGSPFASIAKTSYLWSNVHCRWARPNSA